MNNKMNNFYLSDEASKFVPLLEKRDFDRLCKICGGRNKIKFLDVFGINFSRCKVCGSILCNPGLNEDELMMFYKSDYYRELMESSGKRYEKNSGIKIRDHIGDDGLEWIFNNISIKKKPDAIKLLDVGCGTGGLLLKIKEKYGIIGQGIEINDFNKELWEKYNIKVQEKNIDDLILNNEKFDLVFCSEVLEHCGHPGLFFEKLLSIISNDGYLIITTPNPGIVSPLLLKNIYGWISPPNHINLITVKALKLMAKNLKLSYKIKTFGNKPFSFKMWAMYFDYITDQSTLKSGFSNDTFHLPKSIFLKKDKELKDKYLMEVTIPLARNLTVEDDVLKKFHLKKSIWAKTINRLTGNRISNALLCRIERIIARIDGCRQIIGIFNKYENKKIKNIRLVCFLSGSF